MRNIIVNTQKKPLLQLSMVNWTTHVIIYSVILVFSLNNFIVMWARVATWVLLFHYRDYKYDYSAHKDCTKVM